MGIQYKILRRFKTFQTQLGKALEFASGRVDLAHWAYNNLKTKSLYFGISRTTKSIHDKKKSLNHLVRNIIHIHLKVINKWRKNKYLITKIFLMPKQKEKENLYWRKVQTQLDAENKSNMSNKTSTDNHEISNLKVQITPADIFFYLSKSLKSPK